MKYYLRKFGFYLVAFFAALTLNFAIPRMLPGDPVDIVLIDIGLPGEDGFSVLSYLHELGHYGLVVVSARGQQQDKLQALSLGADAYLIKPLQIIALLDTLQGLMGLEWVYEIAPAHPGLSAARPPSPDRLRLLRETAERGHVRGLLDALDAIGAEQPESSPSIERLRRLAEECDLDAFRDAVIELSAHAG